MIKIFYPKQHVLHAPSDDYEDGSWYPYVEVPERIEACLAVLETVEGVKLAESGPAPRSSLLEIHDPILVEGLEEISKGLKKGEIHQPMPFREKIFMDLSAPVTAGTFLAARSAAGCAQEAAREVLNGDKLSIALCRPPGHHAGRAFCGGYCYFNNAALAAQKLLAMGRVGIIDLDYHHGHGTQDIFYGRSDVAYVSLHADPAVEYPYRWGYVHERGEGQGEGCNLNLPLAPDCGEVAYLKALDQAIMFLSQSQAVALVVSVGFDTHKLDPYAGFGLDENSYQAIGERISTLGLPTLLVFEGGYNLSVLGSSWNSFIESLRR
jgi:acetoin utilization deacetylase AcuC-like enzyme